MSSAEDILGRWMREPVATLSVKCVDLPTYCNNNEIVILTHADVVKALRLCGIATSE